MAVKLGGFAPTLQMPNQVALPVAQPAIRRNLRMDQPEFYQQMIEPQQEQQYQPGIESSQRFLDALQPSQANQPTTEDFVRNQVSRVGAQDWSPALKPSDRVRSPTANLVQPSEFQNFYEQFDIISRMGHNKTAFVQQQAQAKQMQALQASFSSALTGGGQGGGSYGSGKGLYGDIGNSAKLGMLGAVQPYVRRVAQQISGKFGIGNIGGHATSGHIPGSDHYTGKALDVMVGGRKGQSVLWWALNNANPLRIKYAIFNRKYYEPGKAPVAYTGDNPHTGHVHLSFY